MADLKMLHYKQIQYEFCSKGHISFFTRQQHNATYDTDTQFLYMYYIIWQDTQTRWKHWLQPQPVELKVTQ